VSSGHSLNIIKKENKIKVNVKNITLYNFGSTERTN
jgi:hypothetical protein